MCLLNSDYDPNTDPTDHDYNVEAERHLAQHTGQHRDCGDCCRYANRLVALADLGYDSDTARALAATVRGISIVSGW